MWEKSDSNLQFKASILTFTTDSICFAAQGEGQCGAPFPTRGAECFLVQWENERAPSCFVSNI